jgi:ankyrin repeat protein
VNHALTERMSAVTKLTRSLGQTDSLKYRFSRVFSSPLTTLFLACQFGFLLVISYLSTFKNVDLNQRNDNVEAGLHLAASEGNKAVVQQLLENGADIDTKDSDGCTALHWAGSEGHKAVVRMLLEEGTEVEVKSRMSSERSAAMPLCLHLSCPRHTRSVGLRATHSAAHSTMTLIFLC